MVLRQDHGAPSNRQDFLWTLFEGVPKSYRDCYEEQVLDTDRRTLIYRIFFESSSPLRTEAENWFLRELRGRYDMVLKCVARHPGWSHKEIVNAVRNSNGDNSHQLGGYLKILSERYRLIERRLPIFADREERRGRYYLIDNFLLVAVNETDRILRFGSCKRSPKKLLSDITHFKAHVRRFLDTFRCYQSWTIEYAGIAPRLDDQERAVLHRHDVLAKDLNDLTRDLT